MRSLVDRRLPCRSSDVSNERINVHSRDQADQRTQRVSLNDTASDQRAIFLDEVEFGPGSDR